MRPRKLETAHDRRRVAYAAAERVKNDLAKSVLIRCHEALQDEPDITEFDTPLLRDDMFVRRILRGSPEAVTERMSLGRAVSLTLNETTEPPTLHIKMGAQIEDN